MDLKILLLIVMMNHISLSSLELLRAPQQPHNDYAFTKFRPPPPPRAEPTFIQRITSWFFPWGYGATEEENYSIPASPKIDHLAPPVPPPPTIPAQSTLPRFNPVQVRDTEPTTARTTRATNAKCSPCNKVPWIPMIPTYQLPIVKGNNQQQQQQSQQQQVYFKHYFGNENQYAQVPPIQNNGYKYSSPTLSPTYGTPPKVTEIPSTTPLKLQENFGFNQGHHVYGIPQTTQKPIKIIQTTGYHYTTPSTTQQGGYQYTIPSTTYQPVTTLRPNLNTIDTSVITFTTNRPQQNNRPSRFTSIGNGVTNAEYIPPPNILPLEGENGGFVPIPIPNLSPTPIPPLFDAKDFHESTYTNQQTGFIKLVPLEPVAQLSSNVNVHAKLESENHKNTNNNGVEVISSNLVAEFTIPPETARDDKIYINQNHLHQNINSLNHQDDVLSQQAVNHNPSTINIDIRNNIDNINTTLSAPIVVESLESNAADNVLAESENNYQQNVNQDIDVISLDQLKDDNDEGIVVDHTNRVPLLQDNILDKASEEEEEEQPVIEEESTTTTEGNYYVKFEPSIQTAADLADEARKKNQTNNNLKQKDRETPLELLDSPIFHITPIARTTLKTTKAPLSNTPPPFKPIEDYTKTLATLWYSATSSLPITSSTEAITSTEVPTTMSTSEATTINHISKLSSTLFSGINLPKEPILKSLISSTKKPKQIQIVIPYTSYHKPSPFKPQNEQEIITYKPIRGHYVTHPPRIKETSTEPVKIKESSTYPAVSFEPLFNAHGYHNDQEYHEHVQESKIVESKLEPPKPTRQLTKIVANNIRDLLKKEKTPKPPKVDIIKLQKNIDGWTEQTFKGKASTIALTGHTKPIPSSFLTTTSKATTYMKIPTTTLAPKTTFDPDLMEETRKQYDNILYKKDEQQYVKRHDRYLDRDNELLLLNNNLTHNLIHPEPVKIYAPKTTLSPRELWKRLHITISPLNNEKIYVVTPQPIKEYVHQNSTLAYKPRFAIRPTPGKLIGILFQKFSFIF